MKKPKFISIMVILSLLLCVIYGGAAVLFQYYTGEELSPTLTENWFQVFGIEIAGTTIIYIVKRISKILETKDRIDLKKEHNLEITEKDFPSSSSDSVDFVTDDPTYDDPSLYG